uniref:Ig-like domain-containing protein n=1 Tax=Maylandia zebra TaxID=106582 RepID=A0A3P9CMX3_9CICH
FFFHFLSCVFCNTGISTTAVLLLYNLTHDLLIISFCQEAKSSHACKRHWFIHWYKQSFGGTLNLTILKADQDDEGIYHCANTERIGVKWSGTYLLVKGNTQRTSNYTVSQLQIESNPVRSGDTMTLQCSVFSDSDNQTCPGGLNILWFRTGSNNAHPNIIYTDTNRSNDCEKSSDPQDRCVFQFSKNVSSSDAGTYYCAVATCGEILFGKGITLELAGMIFCLLLEVIVKVCWQHMSDFFWKL